MKNYQFIALIVLILLGIGSTHYILSKIPTKITANMLAIEYNKVGGMNNYVKLNEINRQQIIAGLQAYEAQNGKITTNNNNLNKKLQVKNSNVLTREQISSIVDKGEYILGSEKSDLVILEYSDLECPYCKALHESGVFEKIVNESAGKISLLFKHFPLVKIHPKAFLESQASLCVGELLGNDKYHNFITSIYAGSKTNGNSYDKNSLVDLAVKTGAEKGKVLVCIDSGKIDGLITKQYQEGINIFGIKSTPTTVLLNTKTGEWLKIVGAQKYDYFVAQINNLLK